MPTVDPRDAELAALANDLERLAKLATPAMLEPTASPTAMAELLRLGAKHQKPRGRDWESANYDADGALLNLLAISLPTILAALRAHPAPDQSAHCSGEEAASEWDGEARRLYNEYTANHPTIHCNRFPSWSELSAEDRTEWLNHAALTTPEKRP
jgi:hypothetical protein